MEATEKKDLTMVEQASENAKNYFKQGLNCTECVMASFMDIYGNNGLPREILSLATGFGGGLGNTKNTCGAITGAVMAMSLALGRKNPMEKETTAERIRELNEIYDKIAPLVKELEEEYGTLICKELSDPHGDFAGKARKKNCMQMIGHCAELAMKHTLAQEEKKAETVL